VFFIFGMEVFDFELLCKINNCKLLVLVLSIGISISYINFNQNALQQLLVRVLSKLMLVHIPSKQCISCKTCCSYCNSEKSIFVFKFQTIVLHIFKQMSFKVLLVSYKLTINLTGLWFCLEY